MRSFLAWLLLLIYLPVLGAGLRVGWADAPVPSATHQYVHSVACQQEHYLLVDCFEHCNDEQYALQVKVPTGAGLHFLVQIRGLDVHCADWQNVVLLLRPRAVPATQTRWPLASAAVLTGFARADYQPPKQG